MLNYCKAVESSWIIRLFNALYSVFQGNDSTREDKLKKTKNTNFPEYYEFFSIAPHYRFFP